MYIIIFLESVPRSEIAESYGDSMFNSLRIYQAVFHNTILYSTSSGFSFSIPSPALVIFLLKKILIIPILVGVRRYLIVILTFLFVSTDGECLLIS